MNKIKPLHIVFCIFSLLLMAFCFSKSFAIKADVHQAYQSELQQQSQSRAVINQNILKARYSLLSSYDPLVSQTRELANLATSLKNIPGFIQGSSRTALNDQLKSNQDLIEQQADLVEQFKSQNAVLKNSLNYLPVLSEDIADNQRLTSLLNDVFVYTLSSDESLRQDLLARLKAIQSSNNLSEVATLATKHIEIVLSYKRQVDSLMTEILALPLGESSETLGLTYQQGYSQALRQSKLFLQLGYGILVLLVLALAYFVILSIQKTGKRTQNILESITDAFVAVNSKWQITYTNSTAQSLLPHQQDSKNLWEMLPPELGQQRMESYQKCLTAQELVSFEGFCEQKAKWFEVRLYPSLDGLSVFLRDITDKKVSEDALTTLNQELDNRVKARTTQLAHSMKKAEEARAKAENAQAMAEEANKTKSEFLANMSHELRTPLNAIIGYSEILEEDAEDCGHDDYIPDLQKIRSAGKHLLGLINDVLDLSKVEAGQMELYLETFDVPKMVKDVVSTIYPLTEKNGNALSTNISGDIAEMKADMTKVRQSLFNLLSNASKFTQQGTISLDVSTRVDEEKQWLIFQVKDSGIGMTPEQMNKIFNAFSQADASTTRKYGGTGLGLTITQTFAKMMGGEITVESELGKGTTFSLILPQTVQEIASPTGQALEKSVTQKPTVLVIDDSAIARKKIYDLLDSEGCHVVVANTAEQGLHLAEELRPHLITLDVVMPDMDGWSTLTELKRNPDLSDIPVIMITMDEDSEYGKALGAADFLTKPVERDSLRQILNRYTGGRSSDAPILVVEDDANARELVERLIEREGFSSQSACNGQAALDKLNQFEPSLILLDLMMPDMDGFELLHYLKMHETWSNIPVIVLTAKVLTPAERQLLVSQTQHVFTKGDLNQDDFLREVKKYLSPVLH